MNKFFSIIGIVCVVLAIAGAVVPGFNFHLVFADDKSAQAFHEEASEKLKKRIAAKARAAASQGDRRKT